MCFSSGRLAGALGCGRVGVLHRAARLLPGACSVRAEPRCGETRRRSFLSGKRREEGGEGPVGEAGRSACRMGRTDPLRKGVRLIHAGESPKRLLTTARRKRGRGKKGEKKGKKVGEVAVESAFFL